MHKTRKCSVIFTNTIIPQILLYTDSNINYKTISYIFYKQFRIHGHLCGLPLFIRIMLNEFMLRRISLKLETVPNLYCQNFYGLINMSIILVVRVFFCWPFFVEHLLQGHMRNLLLDGLIWQNFNFIGWYYCVTKNLGRCMCMRTESNFLNSNRWIKHVSFGFQLIWLQK